MIRVLSIAWYKILPAKYGGQKGIALFNQELAKHFPLVCLCSENNEPSNQLHYKVIPALPVNKGQFLSPATWKRVEQIANSENATHIILEHPYHGPAAFKARRKTDGMACLHYSFCRSVVTIRIGSNTVRYNHALFCIQSKMIDGPIQIRLRFKEI